MANPTHPVGKTPPDDEALDDALADSFPASDPVAPAVPHRSVRADEKRLAEHVSHHNEEAQKK